MRAGVRGRKSRFREWERPWNSVFSFGHAPVNWVSVKCIRTGANAMVDDDRPHHGFLQSFRANAWGALRSSLRYGADILFPAVCIGCRMQVSQPGTLCPQCWLQLRFIEKPYGPVLGIPFTHDFGENFMSAEAIADPPPFRRLRSVVQHDGAAQRMAVSLKFH